MNDGDCTRTEHEGCCCPHHRKFSAACTPCEEQKFRVRLREIVTQKSADKVAGAFRMVGWRLKEPSDSWAVRNLLAYDPVPRDEWEPVYVLREES